MFSIDRRRAFLSTFFASGALSSATSGNAFAKVFAAEPSLGQVAAKNGLFYGCAVRSDDLRSEADFRTSVLEECSYLTPETALKWAEIEPVRGELTLAAIDDLLAFATSHGKKVRGHTLLWHRSVPSWAQLALKADYGWTLIERYFASVIPRYGAVIDQWDVVNEPVADDQEGHALRENIFMESFGPDYVSRAMFCARKYAPHAKLMINEYGIEYDIPQDNAKRSSYLALIQSLKKSGAPLDGVGLQSHLDLSKGSVSKSRLTKFLDAISQMGLFFVVTELDVKEVDYTAPARDRDRIVAEEVGRYLDIVLNHPAARGVITWGLSDRHTWLKMQPNDFSRYPTAWHDGTEPGPNRGLPFDAAMDRTPMYFAILKALNNVPKRPPRS